LVLAVGKVPIEKSGVGKSHRLGHELLALKIVEVGDRGEGVKDQCGQLGVVMDLTAFSHLNKGVGASALVAQDGARELEQGILHGGSAPYIATAKSRDPLLAQFINLKHRFSDEVMSLDDVVTLLHVL
jgi:hypothetical protein